MSNINVRVTAPQIGDALSQILEGYRIDAIEGVEGASRRAVENLVKETKATAPVGFRKKFKRSIDWKEVTTTNRGRWTGRKFAWYVKPPDYRLTHLLVHGHATKDGGRTKADPFLHNAIEKITPEYIEDVEDALKW